MSSFDEEQVRYCRRDYSFCLLSGTNGQEKHEKGRDGFENNIAQRTQNDEEIIVMTSIC